MPDKNKITHPSALITATMPTSRKTQYLFSCKAFMYQFKNRYNKYRNNRPASNIATITIAAINITFPIFLKTFIMIFLPPFMMKFKADTLKAVSARNKKFCKKTLKDSLQN